MAGVVEVVTVITLVTQMLAGADTAMDMQRGRDARTDKLTAHAEHFAAIAEAEEVARAEAAAREAAAVAEREAAAARAAAPAVGIPAILARIRGCESGTGPNSPGDYNVTNHHGLSSSSGAYQFIDSTWRAYRGSSTAPRAYLASKAEQDAAALRLYNAEGTRPWYPSRGCWG